MQTKNAQNWSKQRNLMNGKRDLAQTKTEQNVRGNGEKRGTFTYFIPLWPVQ